MIYYTMQSELRELVKLIRQDEQYCAAVMNNKVEPDAAMHDMHTQRAARIAELSARYGII